MRAASLVSFLLLVAAPAAQASKRPNIVFIFSDDHACHAISAYGSRVNQTPHIDRLAKQGMLFRNAFVTNSICAPSRAVILTGKHSHRNGQHTNGEVFDGAQATFPKLLRAAGYQTALVGKWHLVSEPTGFDHWQVLQGQGPYYNPRLLSAQGSEVVTGYTTDLITDLAVQWLEERDDERPFLLMVQHKAPHREWLPAQRHLGLYADADLPEPPTLFDDWRGRAAGAAAQTMSIRRDLSRLDLKLEVPRNLNPAQAAELSAAFAHENQRLQDPGLSDDDLVRAKYQRYVKDYLRCVAAMDENIGRLLDHLDTSGLAADTVVVYASDQGFYLGDHGWYDKRWMYEESLRFPLIVRWPGAVRAGSDEPHFVQNLDVAQTFLEIAGVEAPADMQGRSLVPLLRGTPPADWRESVYYHYWENPGAHNVPRHYGVRTQRHKLIRYYQLDAWELFDLERDPHECKSVYGEPAYAEVQVELERELRRLQTEAGDDDPHRVLPHQAQLAARAQADAAGKAVQATDARAAVETPSDVAGKALTVGAHCVLRGDGVVLAHGGSRFGYALYFSAGVPCFAVRDRGTLSEVRGSRLERGAKVCVQGMLDAAGTLHLFVDGQDVGSAPGRLLSAQPREGLALARDPGSAVGSYAGENAFAGDLTDVRVYLRALTDAERADWVWR